MTLGWLIFYGRSKPWKKKKTWTGITDGQCEFPVMETRMGKMMEWKTKPLWSHSWTM
jgi:hypothetical protein